MAVASVWILIHSDFILENLGQVYESNYFVYQDDARVDSLAAPLYPFDIANFKLTMNMDFPDNAYNLPLPSNDGYADCPASMSPTDCAVNCQTKDYLKGKCQGFAYRYGGFGNAGCCWVRSSFIGDLFVVQDGHSDYGRDDSAHLGRCILPTDADRACFAAAGCCWIRENDRTRLCGGRLQYRYPRIWAIYGLSTCGAERQCVRCKLPKRRVFERNV
jgi:hypothetical protein